MAETSLARGFSKLIQRIKRVTNINMRDKLAELYCQQARQIILSRTISGKGVSRDSGNITNLKKLSASYILYRQRNRKRLASYTSPTKSNLTFTGELLSSLSIKRFRQGSWQLRFEGQHGSGISNAKLARYVSEDRPFLNLSASEQKVLAASYRRNFAALVKRDVSR